ncbi:MAG: GTPase [Candidatus Micrarchaeaceae archaeon]
MDKEEELIQKLEALEKEYRETPYNKTTDKYLGMLRRKISRTKLAIKEARKRKHSVGFIVKQHGDATVALVGLPNAGKSSLLNKITSVGSKVGNYSFTTTIIVESMLIYKNAHIQLLDLPGIIEGAHIGAGLGKRIIAAIKTSDLLVFVIDGSNNPMQQLGILINELEALGLYVHEKPDIKWVSAKVFRIDINKSRISNDEIEKIFRKYGAYPCEVKINGDVSQDELMAIVSGRAIYLKGIVALNKVDIMDEMQVKQAEELANAYKLDVIPISAITGFGIEALIYKIYSSLHLITVYLKPKDEKDLKPMVGKEGITVADVARKIHSEILEQMKCAYITGPSVKFKNQRVSADHILKDGDIVTLVK